MATSVVGSNYQVMVYANPGTYSLGMSLTAIPTNGSDPTFDITFTPPSSGATYNSTTPLELTFTIHNKSADSVRYPIIRVDIGWPDGDTASVNNNLSLYPQNVWVADPVFRPCFRINGFATEYGTSDNRGCYAVPYLYGEAGVNGIKSPIVAFSDYSSHITAIATNINVSFAFHRNYTASNRMVVDIVPGVDLPLYGAGVPAFLTPDQTVTFKVWVSNVPGNTSGIVTTTSEAVALSGAATSYLNWFRTQKANVKYGTKLHGQGIAGVDLALPDATTSTDNRYYRTFGSVRADTATDWGSFLDAIVKSITGQSTVGAAIADLKGRQIGGLLLRGLAGSIEELDNKNFRIRNGYAGPGSTTPNMLASCANIFGQPYSDGTAHTNLEILPTGIFGPETSSGNGSVDIIDWHRVTFATGHASATMTLRANAVTKYGTSYTRSQYLNFINTQHLEYFKDPLAHVCTDWENCKSTFDLMAYNATNIETSPSSPNNENIQIPLFAQWLAANDAGYQALSTQADRVNYVRPLFNAALADLHLAVYAALKTQIQAYAAIHSPLFDTSQIKFGTYSFAMSDYSIFAYSKTYSSGYAPQIRAWLENTSTMWDDLSTTGLYPTLYNPYIFYNDIFFLGPGRARDTAVNSNIIDNDSHKTMSELRLFVYGTTRENVLLAQAHGNQVVCPFVSERCFQAGGYLANIFSYQYGYAQVNHGSGYAADVAKRFLPPGTLRATYENVKAAGATEAVWWGQIQAYNNEEVAVANYMSRYMYNTFHSLMHPFGMAAYDKAGCIVNLPENLLNSTDQIQEWADQNAMPVYAWVPNAFRAIQAGVFGSSPYDAGHTSCIANEIDIGSALDSGAVPRSFDEGTSQYKRSAIQNNVQEALSSFSGIFMSNIPDAVVDPWILDELENLRSLYPEKLMVAVGQKTDMTYGTVAPCMEDAFYLPHCAIIDYAFQGNLQTFVLQNEFDFASHMGRTEERFQYIIDNGDVPVMFNVLPTNKSTGSTSKLTPSDQKWQ